MVSFTTLPLYPWETGTGTHWIGGYVGPRDCLNAIEKEIPCPCSESNPGSPASSLSLYRLIYLIIIKLLNYVFDHFSGLSSGLS
jgi:hypothetical protein